MSRALLPALTSILALLFAVMLLDQWRERRHGFQLVWAFGMLCYAIGAGAEAVAAADGWNEGIYRAWYLTGAIWTAGWLGPRHGVPAGPDAVRLHVRGPAPVRRVHHVHHPQLARTTPGAGALPLLYLFGGGHPGARDRRRDVLRQPALAAVRGAAR